MRNHAVWLLALALLALLALSCGCQGSCRRACVTPEPVAVGTPDAEVPAKPRTLRDYEKEHIAALMRGIDDPDTIVDWAYVQAIVTAPGAAWGPGGRGGGPFGVSLTDEEIERIGSRLHKALPNKRGAALLPAVEMAARLRFDRGPEFRDAVIRAWPEADADTRSWLLSGSWTALRDERMIPLLLPHIEGRPEYRTPWHSDDVSSVALQRYLDLEPAKGRALVLADIRRKKPAFGGVALTALSDKHLEAVDANFRRPLEELTHFSFDMEKHAYLAERYGGSDTLAKARAILDLPKHVWDTRLLRVVMRHDREEAFRRMAQAIATRDPQHPYLHRRVLSEVLASNWIGRARYWGPDAEAFVRGYLDDPDTRLAADAAELLRAHGTDETK